MSAFVRQIEFMAANYERRDLRAQSSSRAAVLLTEAAASYETAISPGCAIRLRAWNLALARMKARMAFALLACGKTYQERVS